MSNIPYRSVLQKLYRQAGYSSLEKLAQAADISTWHLYRIERGLLAQIPVGIMVKLAIAINLPLEELLLELSNGALAIPGPDQQFIDDGSQAKIETLEKEYERLQQQLTSQQQELKSQFQREALEVLEPWLLQWPTAAAAAQQNPQWSAQKLLPLTRPIASLLEQWQVEAIAAVGETVAYDPQCHQFLGEGQPPELGELMTVRYVGYRWGEVLLYRAKVSYSPEGEK
jgi:molecular chaperone GrpE (heat shock protein)